MALVSAGVAWAAPSAAALRAAASRLAAAPWPWLGLAAAAALAPLAVEAARVWWVARALGCAVGRRGAIDAAAANGFFTAITPATGLGEPAVAWVLRRGGAPAEVALAVPMVKFTTSFTFVFAVGAAVFVLGGGPPVAWLRTSGALACAGAALVMATVIAIARDVDRTTRALAWLGQRCGLGRVTGRLAVHVVPSLTRIADVRGRGMLGLMALHALYFVGYAAPLVLICHALVPGTAGAALPRALAYLCATFLAPTPGGAGVAEASSVVFFGDLIGPADAVIAVVAFRIARFVAQVVVPGVYLATRGLWRLQRPAQAARDQR
ncbi:MAG: flippase-like domain-containing protein [Myxococcales bacterium]|nr:flippase-like domain-containing protein [Myxococcales bacterium]